MERKREIAEREFRGALEKCNGYIDYDTEGYKCIIESIASGSKRESEDMLHLFFSTNYDKLSAVGVTSAMIRKFLKVQYKEE